MTVRSRDSWGARPPKASRTINGSPSVTIHWEGVSMGEYGMEAVPKLIRAIQGYHMANRGWSDIAYNVLVDRFGNAWEGRGVHVRSAAQGTNEGNASSYALCVLIGPDDRLTPEAAAGVWEAIDWLRRDGGASLDVWPHHHWHGTACPGPLLTALASGDAQAAVTGEVAHSGTEGAPSAPSGRTADGNGVFTMELELRQTKQGDHGQGVSNLQGLLVARGYRLGVDGDFGPITDGIVRRAQQGFGIGVDGIAGPDTLRALLGQ